MPFLGILWPITEEKLAARQEELVWALPSVGSGCAEGCFESWHRFHCSAVILFLQQISWDQVPERFASLCVILCWVKQSRMNFFCTGNTPEGDVTSQCALNCLMLVNYTALDAHLRAWLPKLQSTWDLWCTVEQQNSLKSFLRLWLWNSWPS